nr:methionine--tRNA ligase subunit beta [Flavisolibacter sp.]
KDDWKVNVTGQCKSWIDAGLQARAVTRDLDWGVKLPPKTGEDENADPDRSGKVLYVWFDAPIGYISATKQWALNHGKDWKPYWMDPETKLVHFIGKDNIVFHCIIFPVMLKLHGYIVPENVPGNEFMNLEGDKMSTSRNWKLDMQDFIDDFINKENGGPQMADALRYYLTTILPETKDSEFTWKGFQDAVNGELVAAFANFFNRTFVLMHKLTGGKVPKFHNDLADEKDRELIEIIKNAPSRIQQLLEEYKFREALFEVIDLSRRGNKYMQDKEPWIKAKDPEAGNNQSSIENCLHICLQLCANLSIYISPFLPNTAKKMCQMMKVVDKMLDWENAGSVKLLSVGYSLRSPALLFRKIEDAEVEMQVIKLKKGLEESKMQQEETNNKLKEAETPANSLKTEIVYDDFDKIDLRIGTILHAEKVAKADKLLKLEVEMGMEKRTIVSGIAQHFSLEALVGKQVIVVANLAPRKMRGIESQGMILTAEQPDGKLILVNPDTLTQPGSQVK